MQKRFIAQYKKSHGIVTFATGKNRLYLPAVLINWQL
jgi:hypothetical protein